MQQFIDFIIHHWELWVAFIVALCLLAGMEFKNILSRFTHLSPQEVINLINRQDAVVLDIRDEKSFMSGHILNSINIPHPDLPQKTIESLEKHKDKPIILVYNTGQSQAKMGSALLKQGFSKIYCLNGGIAAWQNAGLPLSKTSS